MHVIGDLGVLYGSEHVLGTGWLPACGGEELLLSPAASEALEWTSCARTVYKINCLNRES